MSDCVKTDCERRFSDLESDVSKLNDKMTELDKDVAVTTTSILQTLKGLEKLPETLNSVTTAMHEMKASISSNGEKTDKLTKQLDALSCKVEKIDSEGKFNIREYIKNNWIKIVIAAGVLGVLVKEYIK